jgi:hypothetical protein
MFAHFVPRNGMFIALHAQWLPQACPRWPSLPLWPACLCRGAGFA